MNLDELERLHREASPGKWAIYLHSWHTALVTDDKSAKIYHDEIAPEVRQSTDAAYIAALHNAFPALLALARDGERYRWLRLSKRIGNWNISQWTQAEGRFVEKSEAALDAAIDAARKGEKP